jgi:DNA-binding transcriptional ArsR family regulator
VTKNLAPRRGGVRGTVCTPKPDIRRRTLIGTAQSWRLEATFKALANSTRIRLLHALARTPGLCVNDLAEAIGMKPQAVSNQLQRLVDRGILEARRNGTNRHYRIVDPCVTILLDRAWCLAEDAEARAR